MLGSRTHHSRWVVVGLLVLGAAALLSGLPAALAAPPSQTGTELRYGDAVTGEVNVDVACLYYWFDGSAGDFVTIDMARTSGSLDGVLSLYLRDGSGFTNDPIATNDDRPGGGLDPLIAVTLPQTDWYTIAACRLDNENMRVTEGTFRLTLSASAAPPPGAIPPTATPVTGLSESVFPSGDGSADQASPTPAPTMAGGGIIFIPSATPSGDVLTGQLAPGAPFVSHTLAARPGDKVAIQWQRLSGDFAPQITVLGADGALVAQASSRDSASSLQLVFVAPAGQPLAIHVGRYQDAVDNTAGDYELRVQITALNAPEPTVPALAASPTPAPLFVVPTATPAAPIAGAVPTEAPAPADTLAEPGGPCSSGPAAVVGPADGAILRDVYMAAGDGYTPEQVTPSTTFRVDDDLNVVFSVPPGVDIAASALFCAPDGSAHDAGSGRFSGGDTYLLGLDWEFEETLWVPGAWYVEVTVDGALDVTLAFTVAG